MRIDWDAVKKGFESGRESTAALAERYGCHRDSIRRKAKKEGWKEKDAAGEGAQAASSSGRLPERHRSFWRGVEKRLARGLKTRDVKQGLEELKVAKMAGEVISSMIRSKRLELGLDDALTGQGADDANEIVAEMARATAPPGAEEAVD